MHRHMLGRALDCGWRGTRAAHREPEAMRVARHQRFSVLTEVACLMRYALTTIDCDFER